MLKLCGLGFSAQENYQISLRLNEIAGRKDVVSCRFWGKVLGREADYLVYEAKVAGQGTGSDGVEARGTGANSMVYLVGSIVLSCLSICCRRFGEGLEVRLSICCRRFSEGQNGFGRHCSFTSHEYERFRVMIFLCARFARPRKVFECREQKVVSLRRFYYETSSKSPHNPRSRTTRSAT